MNTKTTMSLKMDKDLKKAAEETAAEFGLPLGTMINVLVRQVVRSGNLTLAEEYTPTPYLQAIIDQADRDYTEGNISKPMSVKDLRKALR